MSTFPRSTAAIADLADPKLLSERLVLFADDTERCGYPFTAARIRNLVRLVSAESEVSAALEKIARTEVDVEGDWQKPEDDRSFIVAGNLPLAFSSRTAR